jgi:hypothetical protein
MSAFSASFGPGTGFRSLHREGDELLLRCHNCGGRENRCACPEAPPRPEPPPVDRCGHHNRPIRPGLGCILCSSRPLVSTTWSGYVFHRVARVDEGDDLLFYCGIRVVRGLGMADHFTREGRRANCKNCCREDRA